MLPIRVRFNGTLFGIGTGVSGVGAGVAELVSQLTFLGGFLFVVGLPVMIAGLVERRQRPVIVHDRWDTRRVCDAMRHASDDAVIRIRQTWVPDESFINTVRELLVDDGKRFKLDVLLIDPTGGDSARPSPLLSARVKLRDDLTAEQAVGEVRSTLRRFGAMEGGLTNPKSQRRVNVDIDIRLYDSMPFGPIYRVGDDVMFVGFFICFETSEDGPMLEIRNTPRNRWWRQFDREFDEAWSAAKPYPQGETDALPVAGGP
jgi:hypothetical protein